MVSRRSVAVTFLLVLLTIARSCNGGITSQYVRKAEASKDMPYEAFPPPAGLNAPEQVHITQGDHDGRCMMITWVTPEKTSYYNVVKFWATEGKHKSHKRKAHASTKTYKYYDYVSGFIHHATIKHLDYNTKYIYELGTGKSARQFWFVTPPAAGPDVPYTFGIIGDLGQTYESNSTLEHYVANPKGQAVLCIGDLTYADDWANHDSRKWDSWGRFVEKSTAYQSWIWTAGNHEIDIDFDINERVPFKAYRARYPTPYKASGSTSPLWYSIKRASAYIIVLSSYSAYSIYTPQYRWLQQEFLKVNRSETPWLIVLVHSPWYNSNGYHYMEGESMRVTFESWLVKNKVDLVLAGHVHSYERSERVSNIRYNITNGMSMPVKDPSAPIYITIGDGGNIEGIANSFTNPQPDYSAFREASFGHAVLEIKNRTHAYTYYTWHRNQDSVPVAADSLWLYNRYFYPKEESRS